MRLRLKRIADQVMVITGASSGIGLTTAREAARLGARLILAARNEEALRQLTEEIMADGGEADFVVGDVGKEETARNIARKAVERFGGFDTWVNNAGAGLYGRLLDVPTADMRRLFETDFWGVVYGSLEAARHLQHRDSSDAGAIINIGSEASDRAIPLLGAYCAAKHAVKGFTDALRMELEEANAPVSVTLVKPSAIDTPFPLHAKNYMDQEPSLPRPVYSPEVVAEVILHCAETPERDIFAGGAAKMHSVEGGLLPRLTDWFMETVLFKKQQSGKPARHAEEALDAPTTGLRQRSGTRSDARETSLYSRITMHSVRSAAVAVGAGLAVAALVGKKKSNGHGEE